MLTIPAEDVMKRFCSGLSTFAPCEKRDQCANYVHWLDDPRSEFNVCTITGQPFKHYVSRGLPIAPPIAQSQSRQGSLF